ncbi:redoxin domain-containing protein [Candidatus Acetothermia bacterium]|nr:redoxin domain-containing protein [Candidatus Acetothermia bacterium]MBI3642987.1 redoxin domain-containing protein [Candidatus Acetothermia bacterium]
MKKVWAAIGIFLLVMAAVVLLDPDLNAWVQTLVSSSESNRATSSQAIQVPYTPIGILTPYLPLRIGRPAPNFALRDLNGNVVKLSDFRNKRYVLLNFWATWCAPCKEEMPYFEDVYQKYGKELVVLGVDLQESAEVVRTFTKREAQVSYPILVDADGSVAQAYTLFAEPTSFFINKEGRIVGIDDMLAKFGAFTSQELNKKIRQFLDYK